jgi:hypothetical protein
MSVLVLVLVRDVLPELVASCGSSVCDAGHLGFQPGTFGP